MIAILSAYPLSDGLAVFVSPLAPYAYPTYAIQAVGLSLRALAQRQCRLCFLAGIFVLLDSIEAVGLV